ncbi:NADP-dependent oxidoreductase [Dactylosporangium sp. NPDC005572]|uniref:MDR family NADP-dependent oxidoreductase n=1 Tax=Dactylosporangium sp. NPDC005572 TaxID=3156889 RepID=UPI0033AFE8BE
MAASVTTHEARLTHDGAAPITAGSFVVIERELPRPADSEIVVDVRYASLDPSQRIRLRSEGAGFVPPAGIVGTVAESRSEEFAVGDTVIAPGTWATKVCLPATVAERYDAPAGVALHHAVGLLGLTGLTAYHGVTRVLRPSPGEKIVVTGAFGGVGQVAAQLIAASGADVLGVVGGPEKVDGLKRRGITAVDHRCAGWLAEMDRWAPDGLHAVFDNVWGEASARLVERLQPLGRVALCGQMSGIGGAVIAPLPLDNWFRLVTRSLTIQGFRAVDFASENSAARRALADMIVSGTLDQEIHVASGWAAAGPAFADMLTGRVIGKLVVEVQA